MSVLLLTSLSQRPQVPIKELSPANVCVTPETTLPGCDRSSDT